MIGSFNINITSNENEHIDYTIYDMLGKTVLSNSLNVNGYTTENINLENINSGIYHLVIQSNSFKESVRLIVK